MGAAGWGAPAGDFLHHGNDPECALPTQFTDPHFPAEKRLYLALLEQCRRDLHRGHSTPRYLLAKRWVDGTPAPLSFQTVCDHLGFSTDWLRRRMLSRRPRVMLVMGRGITGSRTGGRTLVAYG